jgi:DNA-binding response OmpR family regulator
MRILVVEDEARIASFVRRGLVARGYDVETVDQGGDALERAQRADLVILDIGLPDIDGFEVLRRLRARGDKMPVILLTARGDVDDRVKGFRLGADDYLVKPFAFDELAARIEARLRRLPAGRLLIVGGEARLASLLARGLERLGIEVIVEADRRSARHLASTERFDLVILDTGPDVSSGLAALRSLIADRPGMPVILLTALDEPAAREAAIEAGAVEYVTKPFVFDDLRQRVFAHLEREAS